MRSKFIVAAVLLSAQSLLGMDALAASRTERLRFNAGSSSATIKGSVTGHDTVNFLLGASAGQVISVLFSANSNACYFNFVEPGANSAIHMGEVAGNEYSGKLRWHGDYRAEIYLMRSKARWGKICRYSVTSEISGSVGAVSPGNSTGSSPGSMMAGCRSRAHDVLRARLPDIAMEYEGPRSDGSYAVNGTTYINGVAETFQCSFNKRGNRIVNFVVSNPDVDL
jgi:hypothetical protein